jgi:hypothetical protein
VLVFVVGATERRIFGYGLSTQRTGVVAHDPFPDALLMKAMLRGTIQRLRLGLAFDLVKTHGACDEFVDGHILYNSLCILVCIINV